MEYVGGGTLHRALGREADAELSLPLRVGYLACVASGMAALHGCRPHPIVHADLKSMNVLLTADGKTAKVADFGLAKFAMTMATTVGGGAASSGTVGFKAPEQYRGPAVRASDVFSFAMVVYHSLCLAVPFGGMASEVIETNLRAQFEYDEELFEEDGVSEVQQRRRWLKKNSLASRRPALSAVRSDAPAALVKLMEDCWLDEPGDRPAFADICDRIAAAAITAPPALISRVAPTQEAWVHYL